MINSLSDKNPKVRSINQEVIDILRVISLLNYNNSRNMMKNYQKK